MLSNGLQVVAWLIVLVLVVVWHGRTDKRFKNLR
jgi:hypothetical protein